MPNTKAASCADCQVVRWMENVGDIELCPLHAAAPELLMILEALVGFSDNVIEAFDIQLLPADRAALNQARELREAIRKAESK